MDSVWKASGLWILFFVLFCFETVVGVGVGVGSGTRDVGQRNEWCVESFPSSFCVRDSRDIRI